MPRPAGHPAPRPLGDAGVGAHQERDGQHRHDQDERDTRNGEVTLGDRPAGRAPGDRPVRGPWCEGMSGGQPVT